MASTVSTSCCGTRNETSPRGRNPRPAPRARALWAAEPVLQLTVSGPSFAKRTFDRYARIPIGQPLDADAIRSTVELLFATGLFQDVVVTERPIDRGIELRFDLVPNPRLARVRVVGDRVLSPARIETVTGLRAGEPLACPTRGGASGHGEGPRGARLPREPRWRRGPPGPGRPRGGLHHQGRTGDPHRRHQGDRRRSADRHATLGREHAASADDVLDDRARSRARGDARSAPACGLLASGG